MDRKHTVGERVWVESKLRCGMEKKTSISLMLSHCPCFNVRGKTSGWQANAGLIQTTFSVLAPYPILSLMYAVRASGLLHSGCLLLSNVGLQ